MAACLARSAARLGKCSPRQTAAMATAGNSGGGTPSRRAALAGTAALAAAARVPRPASAAPTRAARLDVDALLSDISWPADPPFEADDFRRFDESDDAFFYDSPRFGAWPPRRRWWSPPSSSSSFFFISHASNPTHLTRINLHHHDPTPHAAVTHIDDAAIGAYTNFLASDIFPPSGSSAAILDVCSSWISHFPAGYSASRVAGLGMNETELARNTALTEYAVQDLNKVPKMPYADASFDVITNCVSVDYLSRPAEVFAEMHRVLKPGGVSVCAFSNRMFPTKAVAVWTSTGDADHCRIVGGYYHFYPQGGWEPARGRDITRRPFIGLTGDPMYVVWARKKEQAA
jgi:hypothetical protein